MHGDGRRHAVIGVVTIDTAGVKKEKRVHTYRGGGQHGRAVVTIDTVGVKKKKRE